MLSRKLVVSSFILFSGLANALPTHPVIREGNVQVRYENLLTEIDSGAFAELHWEDFSIGADETVRFLQPNAAAIAINRVLSANPSSLFGRLEAAGQIVLINPNGIMVGKDAMIDTGSLIASTLDLFDRSQDGNEWKFSASRSASLINEGIIRALGDVIFLGEEIVNRGSILSSKTVMMGAGSQGTLSLGDLPKIAFEAGSPKEIGILNTGSIHSFGAEARIFLEAPHSAIAHQGTLLAKNDSGIGGEIRILGGANHLYENSLIDVSGPFGGGTVLIGGDYKGQNPAIPNSRHTWAAPTAAIFANATETGSGGKVILWGDETTYFRGVIESRGGPASGDGGFIEISSKGMLDTAGHVDLLAANGQRGQLLLDPCTVVISNDPDSGISFFPPPDYTFFAGTANITNLIPMTLDDYLFAGDVIIDASTSGTGGPGTGSITLNGTGDVPASGGITWMVPHKLTLIADGFISIRNVISVTAAVPATTTLIDISAPIVEFGSSTMPSAGSSQILMTSGQVIVTAPTSLSIYSSATVGAPNGITTGLMMGDVSSIVINTGDLLLQSENGAAIGPTLIIASVDINIDAAGDIDLIAGTSSGPLLGAEAQIYTISGGNLTIAGDGDLVLLAGGGPNAASAAITARSGGDVSIAILGNILLQGGTTTFPDGDGAAGIALQGGAGTMSVSGNDIQLFSGAGTGFNPGIIGVVGGGIGPTSVTASGPSGIVLAASGSNQVLMGSRFIPFVGMGSTTINTTFLDVHASLDPGAMSGFALVAASSGDLIVNASQGVVVTGGNGTSDNFGSIVVDTAGNSLTISALDVVVFAGSTMGSYASIESQNGPTTVTFSRDGFIFGGSGMGAYAAIGSATLGTSGDLTVSGGHIDIASGIAPGAYAGLYSGNPLTMMGGNGSVFVNAADNINIITGFDPLAPAFIGTFGTLGTNSIAINGTGPVTTLDLTCQGAQAFISTLGGPISIDVRGIITMTSAPGFEALISMGALGTSDLTIITGDSIFINSTIQNLGTGALYIVVDANFPQPLIGQGLFFLGNGGVLTTAGGAVRIFTATQNLEANSILGLINGTAFTAGTIFIDSNQEIWCTFYPSTLGGFPFTIFYKDCLQQIATQAQLVTSELLADLHAFNEFPGWWERFTLSANEKDQSFKDPYFFRRRFSPMFWQPKSYTVFLHDIIEPYEPIETSGDQKAVSKNRWF